MKASEARAKAEEMATEIAEADLDKYKATAIKIIEREVRRGNFKAEINVEKVGFQYGEITQYLEGLGYKVFPTKYFLNVSWKK